MGMRWKQFYVGEGGSAYALLGGSNLGAVIIGDEAVVIDAGLDKESARKMVRALGEEAVRPVALLITHGHADHFGGAAAFIKRAKVPLYAPPFEAHFIEEPRLEPLFLNGGAAAITSLQGKFTQAKQGAKVTAFITPGWLEIGPFRLEVIPLPGHSPQQVGLGWEKVLFCGDALFPRSTLDRHPILFCYDMDAWLETLSAFPTLMERYHLVQPGHGEILRAEEAIALAEANAARLEEIRARVLEALRTPHTPEELLEQIAENYNVHFTAPAFYLLSRVTILAALTSLERAGLAAPRIESHRLLWQRME